MSVFLQPTKSLTGSGLTGPVEMGGLVSHVEINVEIKFLNGVKGQAQAAPGPSHSIYKNRFSRTSSKNSRTGIFDTWVQTGRFFAWFGNATEKIELLARKFYLTSTKFPERNKLDFNLHS